MMELYAPSAAWALTGGPSQPEMASFEPISTNQMVDLFSGDFTYNIPLMDVGGYPINIAYHSGVGMEQEASWVGLGWNINPGVINRGVRGLPDDFNGDVIEKDINIKKDWTMVVAGGLDAELFGTETIKGNLGLEFAYNSYKGFYVAPEYGLRYDASLGDHIGLQLGISQNASSGISTYARPSLKLNGKGETTVGIGGASYNARTQSLNLNMEMSLSYAKETEESKEENDKKQEENSKLMDEARGRSDVGDFKGAAKAESKMQPISRTMKSGAFSGPSMAIPIGQNTYVPSSTPQMRNVFGSIRASIGTPIKGLDPAVYMSGNYYESSLLRESDDQPSYGYLALQDRIFEDRYQGLADFNRDGNANAFNPNMSYLPPANMTYDILSVSAQGTGGSYRPFRNDLGVVSDAGFYNEGFSGAALGIEAGVGDLARSGGDLSQREVEDKAGNWNDPVLAKHKFASNTTGSLKENVYYKVAGEVVPVSETHAAMGGDQVQSFYPKNREDLSSAGSGLKSEVTYSHSNKQSPRQPRGKLVHTLNGEEANKVGLDQQIKSFPSTYLSERNGSNGTITSVNRVDGANRPAHHTSEITQYEKDGSRYVFGIPALNTKKEEILFNASNSLSNVDGNILTYWGDMNSVDNDRGRDNLYSKTSTPAYAHSYLLTGYLSSDYVDVTGDGISDDDLGNAVKFNWTRVQTDMGWRSPLGNNSASFHPGNHADAFDDKASYTYGEKEMWYLQSIESRNFIAVFELGNREDATGVTSDGVISALRSKKLNKIKLYSKEDVDKNGTSAIPIKTVEFEYEANGDGLCANAPNNTSSSGTKLTLKSIAFKFGNNSSQAFNPYEFTYSDVNPDYNHTKVDKWGGFKNSNYEGLSKEDYPYVNHTVNQDTADAWASAWNLTQMDLPSGGQISVNYEADDYAYVQDQLAMEIVQVVGAGNTTNFSNATNELYRNNGKESDQHYYLYFRLPQTSSGAINSNQLSKMFESFSNGRDDLYYKFKVKVVKGLAETNYVAGYAEVERGSNGFLKYGICSGNSNYGYVKVKPFSGGMHGGRKLNPIVANSMEFFTSNMPDYVMPGGSLPTDKGNYNAAKKFVSVLSDLKQLIVGPVKHMLMKDVAKSFDTSKSFIRLDKWNKRKRGGGHRVKRIKLTDNWSGATSETSSSYGQTYTYTTTLDDGTEISSGVALYEPLIGGEENPMRQPTRYMKKKNPGVSPNWELTQETPLGESFYPVATVGYSNVQVRNIHADQPSSQFYKETQFYTAKDFPVVVKENKISVREPSRAPKFKPPLGYWKTKNHYVATQGYVFMLNDMHGKLRSQAHYSDKGVTPIKLSGTEYKYHTTTEDGKEMLSNIVKAVMRNGNLKEIQMGKEYDVTIDSREVVHTSRNSNTKVSLDVFMPGGVPMVLFLQDVNELQYRSAVVTKLVQQYGLISQIVETDLNRTVTTSNVLYDGHTGNLLVTKVENEFGTPILNSMLPAYWVDDYDLMGHAYRNIGFEDKGGQKVTILDGCSSQESMEYMKYFVYEGLMDSYLDNIDDYNSSFGNLGSIFGNLVTKDAFVPGDEVYLEASDPANSGKLWVINVLDASLIQQMNDSVLCQNSNISGLDDSNIGTDCEGVLSDTDFQQALKVYSTEWTNGNDTLHTSIIDTMVNRLIDYSNTSSGINVCDLLDYFPMTQDSLSNFTGSGDEKLTDFVKLMDPNYQNNKSNYTLNNTSEITRAILNDSDLKGIIRMFIHVSNFENNAQLLDRILSDSDLLNYMICKMGNPGILQLLSQLGCNQNAFDFVRFVLINESVDFGMDTTLYNKNNLTNITSQGYRNNSTSISNYANGTNTSTLPLLDLFSGTTLPMGYENFYLVGTGAFTPLSLDSCSSHLYVECDYSFPYSGASNSSTPPSASLMNGCCLFDNETFDMTGKDLVIFINREGDIIDINNQNVTIVRSGRRNQLNAQVGEISSFESGVYVDDFMSKASREAYFKPNDHVLNASAMEYSQEWVTDRKLIDGITSINPYVYGIRGNFRPKEGYYSNGNRNDLGALNGAKPDLETDGTFKDFMPYWDLAGNVNKLGRNPNVADNWIKSSDVQLYSSVNGNSLEERTPLDKTESNSIYTTELIGPHNLALAVANNARHSQILFEDFEEYSRVDFMNPHNPVYPSISSSTSSKVAHTGKKSLELAPNTSVSVPTGNNYPSSSEIANLTAGAASTANTSENIYIPVSDLPKGFSDKYVIDRFNPAVGTYVISGWVKDGMFVNYSNTSGTKTNYQTTATFNVNSGSGNVNCFANLNESSFVEGWQRFEQEFEITSGTSFISLIMSGGRFGSFIDDLRIYPKESVMKTYVYHPYVMRLAASLDANNYATFYDYDFEGNLVRIRKETEAGIMTIQESAKHTSK